MQETEIKVRNSSQSQCMTAEKRSQRELCSSIGTWHELWSPTNQHRLPAARGLVPPTPRQNAATPSSHEEESICILGEQAGERERERDGSYNQERCACALRARHLHDEQYVWV